MVRLQPRLDLGRDEAVEHPDLDEGDAPRINETLNLSSRDTE
jgi:hypothetical protein